MTSIKRFTPVFLILLSLVGLVTSAYLTQRHFEVLGGRADKPSFCSFSKSFDCDSVTTSRYADLLGVPISSFGFGYYLIMLVSSVFALVLPGKMARTAISWIGVLSGLALIGDLYLGTILLFKIKILCLLCLLTYITNFTQFLLCFWGTTETINPGTPLRALKFVLSSVANPFRYAQEIAGGREMLALAGMNILMALAITALGNEALRYKYVGDARVNPEEVRQWFANLPQVNEDLELSLSPSHGAAAARITIVEFSDFQCPHCKMAAQGFRPLLSAFGEDVRLVFKHYPLDQACNPSLDRPVHDKACLFAQAAICAGKQPGKDLFWRMHDLLFDQGEMLNLTNLADKAEQMGLNREEFFTCLSREDVRQEVVRDIMLGQRLGVKGTPTIIVNGKRLPGLVSPIYFRVIFQDLLSN